MAACVTMLSDSIPDIAGHLMAASIMSAPAAILFAKVIFPETETPVSKGLDGAMSELEGEGKGGDYNAIDAYARGASDGKDMLINIAAMLIAFVGGIWGLNQLWGLGCHEIGGWLSVDVSVFDTLQEALGVVFLPFAYLMGIPGPDVWHASTFLAEKTLINEFVAYERLADTSPDAVAHLLSERTKVILTYALCGFANILSLGILIGGISAICPERRSDVARLAPWALLAGTFACFTTACFAGLLL